VNPFLKSNDMRTKEGLGSQDREEKGKLPFTLVSTGKSKALRGLHPRRKKEGSHTSGRNHHNGTVINAYLGGGMKEGKKSHSSPQERKKRRSLDTRWLSAVKGTPEKRKAVYREGDIRSD